MKIFIKILMLFFVIISLISLIYQTNNVVYGLVDDDIIMNDSETHKQEEIYNLGDLKKKDSHTIVEANTKLVWIDDYSVEHPLVHTRFELFVNDLSSTMQTYSYYTDDGGNFPSGIYIDTSHIIQLIVYAEGVNTSVKNGILGEVYYYAWPYQPSLDKVIVTSGSPTNYARAQQISQALIYANKYATMINGSAFSHVNAIYPAKSTYYFANTIWVTETENDLDYSDWDVIMHEYGHHVTFNWGLSALILGQHSSREDLIDRYGKEKGIQLAWREAIATIFSALSQEAFKEELSTITYVADSAYTDKGNTLSGTLTYYNNIERNLGEGCESTIIGILWDLWDEDTTESFDNSSMSDYEFWDMLKNSHAQTFSDFAGYYYQIYNDNDIEHVDAMGKIIEKFGIAPTGICLSTGLDAIGYEQPTFNWIPNNTTGSLQNNMFYLKIYSSDFSRSMSISSEYTSVTLDSSQWNTIINWPCEQIIVVVYGFQVEYDGYTPILTGPYKSCAYFTKPQFQIITHEDNIEIKGAYYILENTVEIPSNINEKPVTAISSFAFEDWANLENVVLNEGLIDIGEAAFRGCYSIQSITIPATVENIGSYAFRYCTALSNVVILREASPIINIGNFVFYNCNANLVINVPINRLGTYKNSVNWNSYGSRITADLSEVNTINLDCANDVHETINTPFHFNKIFKLDVSCDAWYYFSSLSAHINIYNHNLIKIAFFDEQEDLHLYAGIYYIDIESIDTSPSINIVFNIINKGMAVFYNQNNNILPYLHEESCESYIAKLKYKNTQGGGFYRFALDAITNSSNFAYIYGSIKVYSDYNRENIITKYNDFYLLQAITLNSQNEMLISLPYDGYYYIDIRLNTASLDGLYFNITAPLSKELNLFDVTSTANEICPIFNSFAKGDYIEKLELKQTGKFEITVNYDMQANLSDIMVIVAQICYNQETGEYYFNNILIGTLNENNTMLSTISVLEEGTYYIGYLNKTNEDNITIIFERILTQSGSYYLVPDPSRSSDYGSEVRFNNGSLKGNTLMEGFTRLIYINHNLDFYSASRLDYYWYTSDEYVANISDYGTLLAKHPGLVKIMAVYKNNPSVTYVKDFIVYSDLRVDDFIMSSTASVKYNTSNQQYVLKLNNANCPYPQNTLYTWNIISSNNNYAYTISTWGTIKLKGIDVVIIEGRYSLNPKVVVRIMLTIE